MSKVFALEIGDFVTIGKSGVLTWEVFRLVDGHAKLRSGQTNRMRSEPIHNLRFHSRPVDPPRPRRKRSIVNLIPFLGRRRSRAHHPAGKGRSLT